MFVQIDHKIWQFICSSWFLSNHFFLYSNYFLWKYSGSLWECAWDSEFSQTLTFKMCEFYPHSWIYKTKYEQISARWKNRSVLSFPHRNTDLTMRYKPEYLYETSRVQLRSCRTPGEPEAENCSIETDESNFTLPTSTSPSGHHSSMSAGNALAHHFYFGGKRSMEHVYQCSRILEGCTKDWCLSYLT